MLKIWTGCEMEIFCPYCTKKLPHQSRWSIKTDDIGLKIQVNLICSNCMGDMFNAYAIRIDQEGKYVECEPD